MKHFLFSFLIIVLGAGFMSAQRTIMGTVVDESGTPLIGANIVSKEVATIGTITDIDGNFKVEVTAGVKTLIFSYPQGFLQIFIKAVIIVSIHKTRCLLCNTRGYETS